MKEYNGGTGPLAPDIIAAAQNSNGFVLEIGIFTGNGSTAMIQEGLENHPDRLHISVDWEDILGENKPQTPWWHLVLGDSRKESTLQGVKAIAGDRKPGVIFIDTDHNYGQMAAELALWGNLALPETVWLFHDTWMLGPENVEMNRAIKEYAATSGWAYDDLRTDSHGLGRMRKP